MKGRWSRRVAIRLFVPAAFVTVTSNAATAHAEPFPVVGSSPEGHGAETGSPCDGDQRVWRGVMHDEFAQLCVTTAAHSTVRESQRS
jgi:hypothetical protein